MLRFSFTPDPGALARYVQHRMSIMVQELQAREDKSFTLEVHGAVHKLRYTIDAEGKVEIFIVDHEEPASTLTTSRLTLNVGAFLLPVAESLILDSTGYNPGLANDECWETTEGVSDKLREDIMNTIQSRGFFNIIHQK